MPHCHLCGSQDVRDACNRRTANRARAIAENYGRPTCIACGEPGAAKAPFPGCVEWGGVVVLVGKGERLCTSCEEHLHP